MPWARYDDELPMNRKIAKLRALGVNGIAALGLHVLCNTWSRNQGTGGHIEPHIPEQLAGRPGRKLALILADAAMFDPHDNGWMIHDFDEYSDPHDPDPNRSAAERRRELSEKRAEAGRKGGEAKAANSSSKPPSKPLAMLEQTSSPVPVPVPFFATGNDDEKLDTPDDPSPSSSQHQRKITETCNRYANLVMARPENHGKASGWRHGIAERTAEEQGWAIEEALIAGRTPKQIADDLAENRPLVAGAEPPSPPVMPRTPPHPESCQCDGTEIIYVENGAPGDRRTTEARRCPGPRHLTVVEGEPA